MGNKIKALRPSTKDNFVTLAIVVLFFSISMILVSTGSVGSLFTGLLIPIGYYIILAVSLNLTVGILGELSLGHAGFMCVGAYASGVFSILMKTAIPSVWIRFPLAMLVGGIAAAIFGMLIGIPILRLRGDYLAIVTLAFGEIIKKIAQSLYLVRDINGLHFSFAKSIPDTSLDAATKKVILNGPMAISGIPSNSTILVTAVVVVITLIIIMNLIDSRAGRAFMAIRDNRIAAESVGINISKFKLIVFAVSAFFAGVAGTLFAHYNTVDPTKFDYNMSILILVFVVLGGIGSIRGSVIAAAVLYTLPELLRDFQSYRMLIYAIILIVMMILGNNNNFNLFKQRLFARKWFGRKSAKGEA